MIMGLVEYCKQNSSVDVFYPHAFPVDYETDLNDVAGVARILPTFRPSKGGLATIEVDIIIRAGHPAIAEEKAIELSRNIDKQTAFYIGDTRVVLLEVKNPIPIYIGRDENDRHKYSVEAWILVEK